MRDRCPFPGARVGRWWFAAVLSLLVTNALALDPVPPETTNAAAAYHEGLIAAQAGEYARAKEQFEAALAAAPNFVDAQFNLGLVEQLLEEPARARIAFERVLVLDSAHAAARRSLAAVLQVLGEDSLALRSYEMALRQDSTRTELYYRYAEVVRRLSKERADLPRAVAALRRALAKDPAHPEASAAAMHLGALLLETDDLPGALRAYERALALGGNTAVAHYNCAVVLERLARYREAATHLENAIQLRAPYGAAHFALAGIYYRRFEDDEKALLHYEAAAADSAFAERRTAREHAAALRKYLELRRTEGDGGGL